MAVYFANRIGLGNNRGSVITSAWSQVAGVPPLIAVAITGGTVGIYTDEGEALDKENEALVKSSRNQDASVLVWHPTLRLLAIGWKDGVISFWSEADRRLSEDKQTHSASISSMHWSADGTRLLSGDDSGKVGVWKTDSRMRPVPLVQYQERDCKVTHICFNENDAPKATKEDEEKGLSFYYGTVTADDKASVFSGDDKGHKAHAFDVDSEITNLLYYKSKNGVAVITRTSTLSVHVNNETGWSTLNKVKLPTMEGTTSLYSTWAGPNILASASDKDSLVRMFNLETEENFILTMPETSALNKFSSLAFNPATNCLCAGTKEGRVAMWRYIGTYNAPPDENDNINTPAANPEEDWMILPSVVVQNRVTDLTWGPNLRLLAAVTTDSVYILSKCVLQHRICDKMGIVQLTADKVVVEPCDYVPGSNAQQPNSEDSLGSSKIVTSSMQVTGVDLSENNLLQWSGKKAEVWDLGGRGGDARMVSSFPTTAAAMAIHKDSVFRTNDTRVEICNLQGTVKQTLLFDEAHGKAAHLHISGDYLGVVTTNGYVKMWKVAGREAKQHGPVPGRRIEIDGQPVGDIESIRVNSNGTRISFLAMSTENSAKHDTRLIVYDVDMDTFSYYDFKPSRRYPEGHFWDVEEPKLLAVETRADGPVSSSGDGEVQELEVATLFSTSDDGVLFQEHHTLEPGTEGVVGIRVPYLYLYKKNNGEQSFTTRDGPYIKRTVMRDFTGMENVDEKTRKALLNFSYYLAVGNMDEAYKAVKLIKNPSVWENMAHMCIKTKRLDVAEHCLGNMGHIRGARAIREAAEYKEIDARVATVAVQLGLIQDAQKLYMGCERYDLLNSLYQASGEWEKALETAKKHDRIHLCSTHYAFARHLESVGDMKGAIKAYEASSTHRHEVPRMMFEANRLEDLEEYIMKSEDKGLIKWWARYCESSGMFDKALECYQSAGDYLALVRVHCYRQNYAEASELASETNDHAAAFHLARQFENLDQIPQAIQFFSRAHRFSHALRLAKKHGMDNELMNLALQSDKDSMVDAAQYFEGKEMFEKAVLLYQKGGNVSKALDICFRAQLFESLRTIADDLGDDTDPALLGRCADFFLEHGQFGKAVHLLVSAKDFEKALGLAMEHNILISEDMAEAMTPPKDQGTPEERANLLRRIGKCCKRQGSYHLACKKYTQAGDKVKAMKVLLKSGDTEKIIFFAGVSRQKEIYIMAANYLQTLDWHNDAEVMKAIIQFYTKAHAMDSLSSFYEACAQIEIDEYRDYEKALGALREALRYMTKARSTDKDERMASLNQRIDLCERFVQARKLIKSDPAEMVKICNGLLEYSPVDVHDVESAIRVGDVFALLVEYYQSQENFEQAYHLIEKMRDRNIILSPYLDQEMVESIYKAMGVTLNDGSMGAEEEDTVGEEIAESPS